MQKSKRKSAEVAAAKTISHSMQTTDTDIAPSRRDPASYASRLIALAPGEHVARADWVVDTITLKEMPDVLNTMKTEIRNSINSSVRQARLATGLRYTVEINDMTMPSGYVYVVAIATCIGK